MVAQVSSPVPFYIPKARGASLSRPTARNIPVGRASVPANAEVAARDGRSTK